ncbi:MAG: DUF2061 domain-containing protein [Alphaproteobacteria bacterium]|nr:DUF2061 domain-containing protein [Alphaproteobacteria bacterium]
MMQKIQHSRSFAKAVSWRLLGSFDTFVISYIVTGKFSLSAFIVSAEVVSKTFLYYLHERAWTRVKWGVTAPVQIVPASDTSSAQPERSAA